MKRIDTVFQISNVFLSKLAQFLPCSVDFFVLLVLTDHQICAVLFSDSFEHTSLNDEEFTIKTAETYRSMRLLFVVAGLLARPIAETSMLAVCLRQIASWLTAKQKGSVGYVNNLGIAERTDQLGFFVQEMF